MSRATMVLACAGALLFAGAAGCRLRSPESTDTRPPPAAPPLDALTDARGTEAPDGAVDGSRDGSGDGAVDGPADGARDTDTASAAPDAATRAEADRGAGSKGSRPSKGRRHVEVGLANYYAGSLHGRRTASGERFNVDGLTCAHRTLPFGSRVRVTNLGNGRSIVLRVNDRGPFGRRKGRGPRGAAGSYRSAIDVSPAAARALGFFRKGRARVRIELLGER